MADMAQIVEHCWALNFGCIFSKNMTECMKFMYDDTYDDTLLMIHMMIHDDTMYEDTLV